MTRLLRFLWLAAVVSSLVIGARGLHARLVSQPRTPFTPRATSDLFLSGLTVDRPAESIGQALSTVPEGRAVVFVGPAGEPSFIQALYTFSLLALPHQVAGVRCPATGAAGEVIVPLDADQEISAVVFFLMEPGVPAPEHLAPGVSLLRIPPLEATSPWNTFCSSPPPPSS